jgi:hypothetical protein
MAIPGISPDFLKSQLDSMRDTIGRNITVYTSARDGCPLCTASGYYDSISDNSFYLVCPICSGSFWLSTTIATEILARVHWVSNEAITATPGGKYFLGDAHITVDPSYRTFLESAQKDSARVVVDNQDMSITRINPMGAPEINRVRAILRSMGQRPNSEG